MVLRGTTLVLAALLLAGPGLARDLRDDPRLGPCLGQGRLRLHGRGVRVEPWSVSIRDEGVRYLAAGKPGEARGEEGLIRWEDLKLVETWDPNSPADPGQGKLVGSLVGFAVGVGIVLAGSDPPGDLGGLGYPLTVALAASPFGIAGGYLGGAAARASRGAWVPCTATMGREWSLAHPATPVASPAAVAVRAGVTRWF